MKARITIFVFLFAFITGQVFGNGISINNIGPKSLGMSGAFVGLADDYTAMYWNPAGITQLKDAQIGIFATDIIPMAKYEWIDPAMGMNINAETKMNHYLSPNIFGYIPFMSGKLTAGLGIYVPAGLGAEWDGDDLTALSGGESFEWMSKIAAFSITPGVAYEFNDMISVGVAMNIYYGMFDVKKPESVVVDTLGNKLFRQYEESSDGIGIGFSGGVLIKPIDMLSVGLSFKSSATIPFSGTAKNGLMLLSGLPEETDFDRDVDWPMWFGIGIALKPVDKLTVAFDAHFSQWSESQKSMIAEYKDWPLTEEQSTMHMDWEDCWQIRFGLQYELSDDLTARAGFYHDPAPAPLTTLNILFPSNTYNAITLGASYKLCPTMNIDLGLEYMMGDEREVTMDEYLVYQKAMIGKHTTNIASFSLGFSYIIK